MQPIRIVIADDHPVFRQGSISLFRSQPEFTVAGEAEVTDLVNILQTYVTPADENDSNKHFGLTARELDVVRSIVSGVTNREIAEKFSISEQTVKHHLRNIFNKLGVSNRLELAL